MALTNSLSEALHTQYQDFQSLAKDDPDAAAIANHVYDMYQAACDLEEQVDILHNDKALSTVEERVDLCDMLWRLYLQRVKPEGEPTFDVDVVSGFIFDAFDVLDDLQQKHAAMTKLLADMGALVEQFNNPPVMSTLRKDVNGLVAP